MSMDEMESKNKPEDDPVEEDPLDAISKTILYEVWYSIAEQIFQRVCDVTELGEEEREALRQVALRPNDFQVEIV